MRFYNHMFYVTYIFAPKHNSTYIQKHVYILSNYAYGVTHVIYNQIL